jgi:hypothetical protein
VSTAQHSTAPHRTAPYHTTPHHTTPQSTVALCPALLLLTYSRESRITRRVCTLAVLRRRAPLGGRQRNKHLHGLRPELRHETPTASLQVLRLDHLRWLPGEERPPSGVRQTGIISAVQCSAVQCSAVQCSVGGVALCSSYVRNRVSTLSCLSCRSDGSNRTGSCR